MATETRVDQAIPPTEEEAKAANRGEYAPRGAGRFLLNVANNWAVRLGVAGGGAYLVYQNVPAIHEFVNEQYQNILWNLGLEVAVPTAFNNNADKGVVGEQNAVSLPLSEIQQQFSQPIEEEDTLTFLFPFKLPEGTQIRYQKGLGDRLVDITNRDIVTEAQQKGIKDHISFVLPKDTIIVAPTEGHVLVSKGVEGEDDPTKATWVRIISYDQKEDVTYVFWIVGGGYDRGSFIPLQPTEWLDPNLSVDQNWKKLPLVPQGEPLLETTKSNQEVTLQIRTYRGQDIGPRAAAAANNVDLLTPKFFTEGNKLLVLE